MNKLTINKIDAASRQLNTAIALWFNGDDIVSIHSLACSAHQIVHDLNQKQGGRDLIYDSLVIKDSYRREVNRIFKNPCNFFKHADDDPDDSIEFDPEISEFFIMFTSFGLELLGEPADITRSAFTLYHSLRYPHTLTQKGRETLIDVITPEDRESILKQPKKMFFELYKITKTEPGT